MKTKLLKSLRIFLISSIIFILATPPALADFDWPSPYDAAKEGADGILDSFGLSKNAIVDVSQDVNVAKLKNQGPQVLISFDTTTPTQGEKITAIANPLYFSNKPESMYFTWYLKRADEEASVDNLETFKKRAAQIIASDNFYYDGEYTDDSRDPDNDGYRAALGGEDQRGRGEDEHCFYHDIEKGAEYEFQNCEHLFPEGPDGRQVGGSDNVFTNRDEQFWATDPNDPDTGDRGQKDEAVVAGLGQNKFTWTYQSGDQVGVVVEGAYDATQYSDASYKVMWALPKNKCDAIQDIIEVGEAFEDPSEGDGTISINPTSWPDCPDGCEFTRTVTKTSTSYEQSPFSSYQIGTTSTTKKTETIRISDRSFVTGEGSATTEGGDSSVNVELGTDYRYLPEPTTEQCNEEDADIIGDLTPPTTNTSCCPDELSETNYGDGIPGSCSLLSSKTETRNIGGSVNPGQDTESGNLFKLSVEDFNECLIENLIDPVEGGGAYGKIDVNLSSAPQNPMNDPTGESSDYINVQSTVYGANEDKYLYYEWEIYTASEIPEEGEWGEPLVKSAIPEVSQTQGIKVENLKFKSAFAENANYVRVKLTVSETSYNGTRKGHNDIVISLNDIEDRIRAYSAQVSTDLDFSKGQERCTNKSICPVFENEIIALEIADEFEHFNWVVDGNSPDFSYLGDSFQEPSNIIYIPITQKSDSYFNVNVSATNIETGEKIDLTKAFEIRQPEINIDTENCEGCVPKLLGYYVDVDGNKWPDYSQWESDVSKNSTLNFGLENYSENINSLVWYLNGTKVGEGSSVSLTLEEDSPNTQTLTVTGVYAQTNETRKALSQFWNITPDKFYEKKIGDSIDLNATYTAGELEQASSPITQVLAAVYSGIPSYTAFLLRIALTVFLIIAMTWIIFALIPQE